MSAKRGQKATTNGVTVFGVRHHGPGSARSLIGALEALRPDLILVEGPPDANGVLPLAIRAELEPPIALLVYAPNDVRYSGYYPFAVFSPEWQAIQYGLKKGVVVRFMDLPQRHRMAIAMQAQAAPEGQAAVLPDPAAEPIEPEIHQDPLYWLAKAAGFGDGERWWDYMVEQRKESADIFAGILEAMTALRDAADVVGDPLVVFREAYMRKIIRAAQYEGYGRIAVVCGAWHAPALHEMARFGSAKSDNALLKNLPEINVDVAWVPWTHGRLARFSGYGAGVTAPGWYHHLWTCKEDVIVNWMSRIARLLREQDLDASPAQIIDAVRLAEALASLRERHEPGLQELNEAVLSIYCFGNAAPMKLIYKALIVGEKMGKVPEDAPSVPLQRDLQREQQRLDLTPDPVLRGLELDLREAQDRERSHLLHRLGLLGIAWGVLGPLPAMSPMPPKPAPSPFGKPPVAPTTGSPQSLLQRLQGNKPGGPPRPVSPPPPKPAAPEKGTALETWRLQWQPEFAMKLIEASQWGNTVREAAAGFVRMNAAQAEHLPILTRLVNRVLLADLPEVIDALMTSVRDRAALTSDITHLMDALPGLAQILRYGDVRQTDREVVRQVISGLVTRVCIGLSNACTLISGDAALQMLARINTFDQALTILQITEFAELWHAALLQVANSPLVGAPFVGRACRLLFDCNIMPTEEAMRRLSAALSRGSDPLYAVGWIEGFLKGSGLSLLYDDVLWRMLDQWLRGLNEEGFRALLPILRRTFATFSAAERRQIGEQVRRGAATIGHGEKIDVEQADRVLPTVALLLGIKASS